jgi:hypothetical protein
LGLSDELKVNEKKAGISPINFFYSSLMF